jgi:hypothetical protein
MERIIHADMWVGMVLFVPEGACVGPVVAPLCRRELNCDCIIRRWFGFEGWMLSERTQQATWKSKPGDQFSAVIVSNTKWQSTVKGNHLVD